MYNPVSGHRLLLLLNRWWVYNMYNNRWVYNKYNPVGGHRLEFLLKRGLVYNGGNIMYIMYNTGVAPS